MNRKPPEAIHQVGLINIKAERNNKLKRTTQRMRANKVLARDFHRQYQRGPPNSTLNQDSGLKSETNIPTRKPTRPQKLKAPFLHSQPKIRVEEIPFPPRRHRGLTHLLLPIHYLLSIPRWHAGPILHLHRRPTPLRVCGLEYRFLYHHRPRLPLQQPHLFSPGN